MPGSESLGGTTSYFSTAVLPEPSNSFWDSTSKNDTPGPEAGRHRQRTSIGFCGPRTGANTALGAKFSVENFSTQMSARTFWVEKGYGKIRVNLL